MAVVDFDDFHEGNHKLGRLYELKALNPRFRCTLFAVPGQGSPGFWLSVPSWCEIAVHGWLHPDAHECHFWTRSQMLSLLDQPVVERFFVRGFKAPGWQISDDCYQVLQERGWWVADQHLEDGRRPAGLRTYFYEDGQDRWHGHIQNVCGNGIEETWGELQSFVRSQEDFRFCSEALCLGADADDPGASELPERVQGIG